MKSQVFGVCHKAFFLGDIETILNCQTVPTIIKGSDRLRSL